MLKIEAHKQLKEPQVLEASRVLVRDRFGNPIALVVEDGEYTHIFRKDGNTVRVGDPEFEQILQLFGINRAIVVDSVKPTTPRNPNISF